MYTLCVSRYMHTYIHIACVYIYIRKYIYIYKYKNKQLKIQVHLFPKCMYVFMYVCMYVCMCVCMCVCMSVCLYVCMSVCRYVCMYTYIYLHTHILHTPNSPGPWNVAVSRSLHQHVHKFTADSHHDTAVLPTWVTENGVLPSWLKAMAKLLWGDPFSDTPTWPSIQVSLQQEGRSKL